MKRWIDAHCHLADPRLRNQLDALLERSRAAGVTAWVQGGVDPADWERQKGLRQRFGEAIVPVFGLHPWFVAASDDAAVDRGLESLEQALPEAHALGELGLDFARDRGEAGSRARQLHAFEAQLALAHTAALPLVLHVVHAHPEALALLERHAPYPQGGLVHAFAGAPEHAVRYAALGLYLSIGGAATEAGRPALKASIKRISPEKIVVETDSPDQPPVLPGESRAHTNEPAYLPGIADAIAALAGVTRESLLDGSARRLEKLFFGKLGK